MRAYYFKRAQPEQMRQKTRALDAWHSFSIVLKVYVAGRSSNEWY